MFKKKTNLIQLIDGLVRLIVFENSPFQDCLRVKARLCHKRHKKPGKVSITNYYQERHPQPHSCSLASNFANTKWITQSTLQLY